MRLTFCSFLLLFAIISCSDKPQLQIPEETLVQALSDMIVAETAINRSHRTLKDSVEQVYYKQIYAIHGIDSLTLANDLALMQEDEQLSTKIYEMVSKKLEKLSADHKKESQPKPVTMDESKDEKKGEKKEESNMQKKEDQKKDKAS